MLIIVSRHFDFLVRYLSQHFANLSLKTGNTKCFISILRELFKSNVFRKFLNERPPYFTVYFSNLWSERQENLRTKYLLKTYCKICHIITSVESYCNVYSDFVRNGCKRWKNTQRGPKKYINILQFTKYLLILIYGYICCSALKISIDNLCNTF
jgi:hypothetical protein